LNYYTMKEEVARSSEKSVTVINLHGVTSQKTQTFMKESVNTAVTPQ